MTNIITTAFWGRMALPFAVASLLMVGVASAQTTTPTTTPGAPDTGAGGAALQNVALLTLAAIAGIAGTTYLLRARRAR